MIAHLLAREEMVPGLSDRSRLCIGRFHNLEDHYSRMPQSESYHSNITQHHHTHDRTSHDRTIDGLIAISSETSWLFFALLVGSCAVLYSAVLCCCRHIT
eukprot:COSAG06_NODE_3130_length_5807_cov_14.069727_10_plen_100_part_00